MDFEQLKQTCLVCEKCDLCCTRTHVVFGTGNPNAEVLFIGEAPGRNEDEQGLPFVGRSGQLLDQYLKAIHLDREKMCSSQISSSAARLKTGTLCPMNGTHASPICASSSG